MERRNPKQKSNLHLKGYSKGHKGITYMHFQHPVEPTHQFVATLCHIQRYLVQNEYVQVNKWLYAKHIDNKLVVVAKPDFLVVLQGDGKKNVAPSDNETKEMKKIIKFADIFILFISFECTPPNCSKARSRKVIDLNKVPFSTGKNFLPHCSALVVTEKHARYFDVMNTQKTMKCLHSKKQKQIQACRYDGETTLSKNTFKRSEYTNQFNKAKKFLQDRGVLRTPLSVVIYECPFIISEDMGCALLPLVVLHMITKRGHADDTTLKKLLPMHNPSEFIRFLQELCDCFSTPYCRSGVLAQEISPTPIRFEHLDIQNTKCTTKMTGDADIKRKQEVTAWLRPHVRLPRCDAAEEKVSILADKNWEKMSTQYKYVYEPASDKLGTKRQKRKFNEPYIRQSSKATRKGPPTDKEHQSLQNEPISEECL